MTDEGSGLTRRGWSLFGAAIGLLLGSRLLGTVELAILAIAALALITTSVVWTVRSTMPLRATRTIRPQRTMVGEEVRVDLVVTNDSVRRTPVVAIADVFGHGRRAARFVLPPLPHGEHASAAYRVPTERRGRFALGPLLAVVHDPFGLVRRRLTLLGDDELLVRPRVHTITAPPLGAGTSSSQPGDAHSLIGEGEEFRALREYAQGDDLRRVHWLSSARLDQLMIRQHEAQRHARAIIFLDVRPGEHDHPSFERAVEVTASVAFRLGSTRRDVEVVLSTGEQVRGGTDAILDRLAVVGPTGPDHATRALAQRRARALTVLVVATVDRALATSLVDLAIRGPVVVVTTRAPGIPVPETRLVDTSSTAFATAWDAALSSWPIARSRLPAPH